MGRGGGPIRIHLGKVPQGYDTAGVIAGNASEGMPDYSRIVICRTR